LYSKHNPNLIEGILVGYSDGHVNFERYNVLAEIFRTTNEKRAKLKLPLIDVEPFQTERKFKGPPELREMPRPVAPPE
jgi:hypothetical protein